MQDHHRSAGIWHQRCQEGPRSSLQAPGVTALQPEITAPHVCHQGHPERRGCQDGFRMAGASGWREADLRHLQPCLRRSFHPHGSSNEWRLSGKSLPDSKWASDVAGRPVTLEGAGWAQPRASPTGPLPQEHEIVNIKGWWPFLECL